MTATAQAAPRVVIACGGTGGHLFPGLAIAEALVRRGCRLMLAISPKEVDQHAVERVSGMEICILPAVALTRGGELAFVRGFLHSFRTARKLFQAQPPQAALAMGGFTSASPVLAARRSGARTFLHESNTIPGRANRWLSWSVHQAFVGFPSAAGRLHNRRVAVTGTPVRPQFQPADPSACRTALGLDPSRPVLLVMGGSQGASGINELVIQCLPLLAKRAPDLQWIHLTGARDVEKVTQAYSAMALKAVVFPFFERMELALGAATAAVSRSGASSLAEFAAMRLPAVLIPYPAATSNHQFHNARAFEGTGAARLLEQKSATAEMLADVLWDLIEKPTVRERMQNALAQWHTPQAAERIAEVMLATLGAQARTGEPAEAFLANSPDLPAGNPRNGSKPSGLSRGCRLQIGEAVLKQGPNFAFGREAQVTE
jgi:UDP-N-acetylglucosamine--N-acetylmuramyl-(pentapeptide) pyrophosphoryl-undecaprenol N-acetylglucosamine transferase